jgi:hypothetical protein
MVDIRPIFVIPVLVNDAEAYVRLCTFYI